MNKVDTSALERYLERVRQVQRSRGKQLILTIDEAQEVSVVMAQMLAKITDLQNQIIDLQKKSEVVEVSIGGGSFR